jgi:beta-lysine N6-acetyltransferase
VADIIEKIGRSIVQHGPHNQRVYLMKLHNQDVLRILPTLDRLARDNHYEKILAKIPSESKGVYENQGYVQEAHIPGYFKNSEHALFMCKYFSASRKLIANHQKIQDILSLTKKHQQHPTKKSTSPEVNIRDCRPEDAPELSRIFKAVFKTYPFPIFDTQYLARVMTNQQARYFCIEKSRKIHAIAAAELDSLHGASEMTDFATLPAYRGQGLAGSLLERMEQATTAQGMKTAFSIARALSPGMNILFAKYGYAFGGTLVNNTNISGRIESMNVWYKALGSLPSI